MGKITRPSRRDVLRYAGTAAAFSGLGLSTAEAECLDSKARGEFIGGTFDRQKDCVVDFLFNAGSAGTNHGLILISDYSTIASFPQSAIAIRFSGKYIECLNGAAMYQRSADFPYEHGAMYPFRVQANLTRRAYSVWVTAKDGRTHRIADSFAFRLGHDTPALRSYAIVNDESVGWVRMCDFYVNRDKWGYLKLYRTSRNGREYYSRFDQGPERTLYSGSRDPYDPELEVRGDGGQAIIKGANGGYALLSGEEPRLYFYRSGLLWGNLEATVYMMRVSETGYASTQGIVIGARTEHQSVVETAPITYCRGAAYYLRLLYSPARKLFQKELRHHSAYTVNQVSESDRVQWGTDDGQFPRNRYIGVKYLVRTVAGSDVRLAMFIDPVSGGVPGKDVWTKILEYTDNGSWGQLGPGSINDVQSACGYPTTRVLTSPATSVFIRNTKIKEARYRHVSIRQVNGLAS